MPHSNLEILGDIASKNIPKRPVNGAITPAASSQVSLNSDPANNQNKESFKQQFNQIRQSREADIADKRQNIAEQKITFVRQRRCY
ncbi:MAG: hypothetical protein Q9M92_16080 [Enterobacterales bacterium]|nr:hypothetical protein [Enterobacterales bacterium]